MFQWKGHLCLGGSSGKFVEEIFYAVFLFLFLFSGGCGGGYKDENCRGEFFELKGRPRLRMGTLASPTLGTTFIDCNELGLHNYKYAGTERNGIVYTCGGGFVDISHLRNSADKTAFWSRKIFGGLGRGQKKFRFASDEKSFFVLELKYPDYWENLGRDQKDWISRNIAMGLGKYIAYSSCVWHEILTWFGYKSTGFYSEYQSAFSWEDIYSDLLGIHIGALALEDTEGGYEEAVGFYIRSLLSKLGCRSKETAQGVSEELRGRWFDGGILYVDMYARNLDIGFDDGSVSPMVVDCEECEGTVPEDLDVPNGGFVCRYGFSMNFWIEPHEWEKGAILDVVYSDYKEREERIFPSEHFTQVLDYIQESAEKKYGLKYVRMDKRD